MKELTVCVPDATEVPALLLAPADMRALFVLAHGAGAGMRHAFMEALAEHLAERGVGTFRYAFAYMHEGRRRPDPRPVLMATVRAAVQAAAEHAAGVPMIAGGKSMGGRMTSLCAASDPLPDVRGLAFVGFPLHPAGKPGTTRAEHLADVGVPMLFLQGTRDKLAELERIRGVIDRLGPGAQLHVVEGADHGFAVLKRSGRSPSEVMAELADAITTFATA